MNPILNALIMENCRIYNIDLAKALGNIKASIILSDLLDRFAFYQKYSPGEIVTDKDGQWFYYTHEKAIDRLAMSRKEQDSAIKILSKLGMISKKQMGLPCKRYFTINQNIIVKFFTKLHNRDTLNNNEPSNTLEAKK